MIKIEGKQKLLKLTSTLLIDFLKAHLEVGSSLDSMTVADIHNYCREWIKQNVRESREKDE